MPQKKDGSFFCKKEESIGSTLVVQSTYTYDILGRPAARHTARQGRVVSDTFAHNSRSELVDAQVNGKDYEYAYDNIGNREFALEDGKASMYEANELNQYTAIAENGAAAFVPMFDADGNQTLIKTETGIWSTVYNAENRPVSFSNSESNTVVECAYDSQGRRAYKKVTVNGSVTLHQRYIYRGYLQIAALDLTRTAHPALWYITWDPSEPIATRPLAIQINGTWYTYGIDLTKNICELYSPSGAISASYTYTPFGQVTASGSISQPVQWSSELWDAELGLVYYNWRYYNTCDGRWTIKDLIEEKGGLNLYAALNNKQLCCSDKLGLYIQLFDERIHVYKTKKPNIKLEGSDSMMILGLLLNHLYSGNGEPVYYDLKHLNVSGSEYKNIAESFIHDGYHTLKALKIYNKKKYIRPKRVEGKGFERYLLGDFSISAAIILNPENASCKYEATIYVEDEFNVRQRPNEDDTLKIKWRNLYAFFMDILPNTPFVVKCEKKYVYDVCSGAVDFSIRD